MGIGKYRLDLVGPFRLFAPDGARVEITSKKSIGLIALLATAPGGERTRAWLQTMLWGSRAEAQGQASLRREISTLRKILTIAGGSSLVVSNSSRVSLALDAIELDLDEWAVPKARKRIGSTSVFLEGIDLRDCEEFEDWLREERARLQEPVGARPLPPLPETDGATADGVQPFRNPSLPPKPSVAILPFDEISPDCAGWLGKGIADEIGALLTEYPQLFVVATASLRAIEHRDIPRAQLGPRLGVRYVLDGSVVQVGGRIRVTVQLFEGQTHEQIWSGFFTGSVADIFEVQRHIAARIAPQLWTKIDAAERARALRSRDGTGDGYEIYWRANALFRSWQRESVAEAVALVEDLVARDKKCPWAASLAGFCHSIEYLMGYHDPVEESLEAARRHLKVVLHYGEDNVEALGYAAGTILNIGEDVTLADRLIGHALLLIPAHQPTLFWGGWVDVAAGRGARARERFELALRVNPATGARSQTLCGLAYAHLMLGELQKAYELFGEATDQSSSFFLAQSGLCVAATLVGETDVAAKAAAILGGDQAPDITRLLRKAEHRDLFSRTLTATRNAAALS